MPQIQRVADESDAYQKPVAEQPTIQEGTRARSDDEHHADYWYKCEPTRPRHVLIYEQDSDGNGRESDRA
jgi:hypothetical protein